MKYRFLIRSGLTGRIPEVPMQTEKQTAQSGIHEDLAKVLFTEDDIRTRVSAIGAGLTEEYAGKKPIMLGILKGVILFYTDLIRTVRIPLEVDFMAASSYRNGTTSGELVIKKDASVNLKDRHVIIVEDIVDSGHTLTLLKKEILSRNPASVKVVALLDKQERREVPFEPDIVGFDCPNEFVVGYGLDYDERYRNLPYIGVLKREIYES